MFRKISAAEKQLERANAVLKVFCREILGLTQKETGDFLNALLPGITPVLLERYCALIGHGYSHKIPPGECCLQARKHNAETVLPLNRLPVGVAAQVLYVQTLQRPELLKLYDLGIHPGKTIRLQQLYPAYIAATEQGRLALDNALAKFIFVQRT
ncbi:MAG: ferrous iron transport protein A [Candidatus Margulisbacteria bacterium]|jgi:Fe2+ transport system protein FeoA|nr:ferrous iron transport protein A [Candidatus Margulisiibacteriota bacterium]